MDKEFLKALSEILDQKLDPIRADINDLKTDILGIKTEISGMKTEISGMKTEISDMKTEIGFIKIQQKEHGEILRILLDKAEHNKAEHDSMRLEMANISREIQSMRKDLAAVEIVTARNMENIAHLKAIK